MVHILQEGRLPSCERVFVGNILAQLGDPRFPADALFLPDEPLMGFVEIPQGLSRMGNKDVDEEKPEHEVYLPIYKINRYPVTNAQYSLFINESGYEQEQYWTNEGWEWRDRGNVTQPLQWDNPDFNKPNQPVVGISWHEAVAYCRWLTEKLREMGVIGKNEIARLPTEAEWEKAGRDGFHTEQHLQRTQPWGDDAAKMREMIPDRQAEELGSVGLLPETATELDVVDMVGKVWQWTNSVWSDYPYDPEDGREDIFTEGPRVIRGGSWRSIVFHNRVTSRNSLNPEHRSEEVGFRVALAEVVPVSVSRVQTFFEFAGFDVEEANKDELVLRQREPYPYTKKISPLYVRLVLDRALDLDESVKLCRAAERVYGENLRDHTTVVVIDRPPQTGDLHQIFALRAQQGLGIVPLPTSLIDRACLEGREAEVLRDQLDLYAGRTDLYDIRTAVTDVLSFFGRRSILADLQRRLTSGQSVFVFGVRKVGKSSLLGRLQEETSWPVALVDLEGYSEGGLNYVYREVLDSWRASLRSMLPGLPLPKPIDLGASPARKARKFGEGVRDLLELLAERPRRPGILLFLDELDTSFDHCDYIEFSAALRSIAENPLCRGRFSILATGLDLNLNRMDQLEHGRNPFYEFFAEIPLGMLKKNDTCAMITSVGGQMEIGYEESALDLLVEAGGGHPFLTRQLCSQAIQNLERPGTVDQARAVKAIEDYLGQPRNYLAESLWGIDAGGPPAMEAALLRSLATSQPQTEQDLIAAISPSEEKRAYRLALARLQDQRLIHNVGEVLNITIPLYRHWIRRYILDLSNEAPTEFTDEI
jgi:formylglycine-generating enzyme required for sulfatase activity